MFSAWQLLKAGNYLLRVQQIKQLFFGLLNLNLLENISNHYVHISVFNLSNCCIFFSSHNDSVQCMAFNCITHYLASCSIMEFGLYSLEQKNVQKYKTLFKINVCAWSTNGQSLALGCDNGNVSLRNRSGEEVANIEQTDGQSVWAILWLSSRY